MPLYEIEQFDRVKLKTTKHIEYLSADPGVMPTPHGIWRVVGILANTLLIAKKEANALCRVPVSDVYVVGKSKAIHLMEQINEQKRKKD
jgi:hypothetical protein